MDHLGPEDGRGDVADCGACSSAANHSHRGGSDGAQEWGSMQGKVLRLVFEVLPE